MTLMVYLFVYEYFLQRIEYIMEKTFLVCRNFKNSGNLETVLALQYKKIGNSYYQGFNPYFLPYFY